MRKRASVQAPTAPGKRRDAQRGPTCRASRAGLAGAGVMGAAGGGLACGRGLPKVQGGSARRNVEGRFLAGSPGSSFFMTAAVRRPSSLNTRRFFSGTCGSTCTGAGGACAGGLTFSGRNSRRARSIIASRARRRSADGDTGSSSPPSTSFVPSSTPGAAATASGAAAREARSNGGGVQAVNFEAGAAGGGSRSRCSTAAAGASSESVGGSEPHGVPGIGSSGFPASEPSVGGSSPPTDSEQQLDSDSEHHEPTSVLSCCATTPPSEAVSLEAAGLWLPMTPPLVAPAERKRSMGADTADICPWFSSRALRR
mmetsp:Transcript_1740/g.5140  ORF Transcript_1740/g.5140 Transcript_1740/m.5140 type:complete len:312 (+) Transcript_1740:82-1017(+)